MNITELAAYVYTHLSNHGIKCVLSGGACVSIYTENKYLSYDLDFIENVSTPRKTLIEMLAKINFHEHNRYFINPDTKYYIEFPAGPLSIGSEAITNFNEIEVTTGILRLLTPTDCVKDRLAAYYFWDDKQSLEQAVHVAKSHNININEIKRWSIAENKPEKFETFKKRIRNK